MVLPQIQFNDNYLVGRLFSEMQFEKHWNGDNITQNRIDIKIFSVTSLFNILKVLPTRIP